MTRIFLDHQVAAWAICLLSAGASFVIAGDEVESPRRDALDLLDNATSRAVAGQSYELRYKFAKDQQLRWKVTHLASTETTIKGNTQTAKSSSISTKVWTVTDVAPNGDVTFVHSVDDADMWQKVSDRQEIRYNSKTDKEPPAIFAPVAETIGVPMYVVTINSIGKMIKRESKFKQTEMSQIGLEQMTVPLPEAAVKVGQSWQAPNEFNVRMPDDTVKPIKTRRLYTLTKVHAGLATIDVRTEILTPIHEPKVKLHLLQQLNSGTVKFDIDAGRIAKKEMEWDETIVNFNGAESIMKYLARFTEEFDATERVAATPAPRPVLGPDIPSTAKKPGETTNK